MAPARRGWRPAVPAAVVVASLSVCAGVAFAGGGGVTPPEPPKVTDVVCISKCGGIHKATAGSKVQLSGRHLGHVSEVLFNAEGGGRIEADPIAVASRSVKVRVPEGAATGRPKVTDAYHSATSPTALKIVPRADPASGHFKLRNASAKPRRSYYYGRKKPRVTYMFTNSEPTDVRIDVVKRRRARSWTAGSSPPRSRTRPTRPNGAESGTASRLATAATSSASAPRAAAWSRPPTPGSRTTASSSRFAVVTPTATGSAPRGPATPTRARTSSPAAAPRWSRPAAAGCSGRPTTERAGYYLVIDGKKTGHDYVYMHLRRRSRLRKGQVVRTGQRIGVVGESGNATGCHLHFEEWSAPGWYEGGHFLRAITRHLKKWDRWS